MSRLRPLALAAVAVLALCVSTATAAAKTPTPITDCTKHNGTLTARYTTRQLQAALKAMPASSRAYTTCYATISNQLDSQQHVTPVGTTAAPNSSGGGSGTLILVVVVVVVVLLGGGAAFYAYRRNK